MILKRGKKFGKINFKKNKAFYNCTFSYNFYNFYIKYILQREI